MNTFYLLSALRRLRMAAVIPFMAACLWCSVGCKKKAPAAAPPPLVEFVEVKPQDVPIYHDWIGVLDGLVNAHIRAQVSGYLQTQNYKEGDPIKKGDLLFEIDPRPFKAVLDHAKGQLAQAQARLGKTELDVKRYAPLVKDKAISQEEYDDAVQANLEAQAAVVAAKAQVEQADVNLGFTRIISPIDGIASIANGQIGDLVGPATGELTTLSGVASALSFCFSWPRTPWATYEPATMPAESIARRTNIEARRRVRSRSKSDFMCV